MDSKSQIMYKWISKNKGILNISEYLQLARHMPAKPAHDNHLCSKFTYTWFGTNSIIIIGFFWLRLYWKNEEYSRKESQFEIIKVLIVIALFFSFLVHCAYVCVTLGLLPNWLITFKGTKRLMSESTSVIFLMIF